MIKRGVKPSDSEGLNNVQYQLLEEKKTKNYTLCSVCLLGEYLYLCIMGRQKTFFHSRTMSTRLIYLHLSGFESIAKIKKKNA